MERAIFAGGCFWGMQDLIRREVGVVETYVGYTGGAMENPTYEDIKTGKTGHAEAITIKYDETITSYERLLELFFQIHDPSTLDRQGNDVGSQYRSAVFYLNDAQKSVAESVITRVNASGLWLGEIATTLEAARSFWVAEEFHQDYLEKHPNGYTCHFPRKDWVLPKSS